MKMDKAEKKTESCINSILGDISKKNALQQVVLGASSGWLTGYAVKKFGKITGFALGGGIILLKIGYDKGYLKINWHKVEKQLDRAADRLEEKVTGQTPRLVDKMERYVDKKLDKAENLLTKQQQKVKRWYSSFIGDSDNKLEEVHIFIASFVAGIAVAVMIS